MDSFQTSIEYLKGIGPSKAKMLKQELNINTFEDLITFYPNRYIDRSRFYKISEIPNNNSEIQIIGKIFEIDYVNQNRGKRMVAKFYDDSGQIELVWFRGYKWIRESLKKNETYVVFGKINWFKGKASIPHPEIELESIFKENIKFQFHPLYPSTEKLTNIGFTQKIFKKILNELINSNIEKVHETIPDYLISKLKLISIKEAFKEIHFPKSQESLTMAKYRLKFEELFFIQIKMILKNFERKEKIKGYVFKNVGNVFNSFFKNNLTFELTTAQKKVIKEIRKDLGKGVQMNRLLQGDVGSGKTIVALLAILIAIDNGYQSTLVAPTEILAQQHYSSILEMLKNTEVQCFLLTGSSTKKQRNEIHNKLMDGSMNLLIGTHAILEDIVRFKNLGLAIIDEQHRFGVAQRSKLWLKNNIPPHILVMTATPIPRTLAMSLYGDLDISVIDSMPPGRKAIKTFHRYDNNRLKVFKFLDDEIKKGRQIYIVYPLIKESEKLDYKDLMDGYESISRAFPKPSYQISIVHGQMKSENKAYEMNRFVNGETQIMVATTVIEVGVNVPNASVMLIESAERFGLSQLHQLRGRVGRGNNQSFCILMSNHKISENGKTRLETMVDTNDGFKISEVDLMLRGPGDLIGTQQSGILKLKISDIVKDYELVVLARKLAFEVISKDPKLLKPENKVLKKTLSRIKFEKNIWNHIS
jgi:ATP-dependent DNA helicase RecG